LDEGIEELTLQLDTREELMTSRESLKNLRTLLDLMDKMETLLKFKEGLLIIIIDVSTHKFSADANLARISAQLSQSDVCKNNCSMISSELSEASNSCLHSFSEF
jgi:DNA repair ATPase RecN